MIQESHLIRKQPKKIITKNVTNGEINLDIDQNDKVTEDYKFSQFSDFDNSLLNRDISNEKTFTYLQNLRTGDFSQISQNYLIQQIEPPNVFTSDYFETQMHTIINQFIGIIYKFVFFFQGILGGLCLLQILILNLYSTTFSQQIIRIDQCIRITSFIGTFGAFHTLLSAKRKYDEGQVTANVNELNNQRKFYLKSVIAFVFYFGCYLFINIAHQFAVSYNLNGVGYGIWNGLAIVYTIFAILGWFTSVNNSNHSLDLEFVKK